MDHPTRPGKKGKGNTLLKYTFDGHFLPNTPPDDDTPNTTESDHSNNYETGQSSGSEYSGPRRAASLAAGFRLIANTMMIMELAELEMMKKREMARLETQKRQSDLEDELTQMMLQTQSQIASFVCTKSSTSRKRKRCRNSTDLTGKG